MARRAVREAGAPLSLSERPRERLIAMGPQALSGSELIAVLLATGSAQASASDVAHQLMSTHDTLAALAAAHPLELAHIHGVGPARAAQLAAAFELGRRSLVNTQAAGRWLIRSPRDVA